MLIKSFFIVLTISLTGCSVKEKVVYKDVYLPVKCKVKVPPRPVYDGNFTKAKNIMIYLEILEKALKECQND